MVYDVRGKTIVITGAAQGIGRATAELAASKGANLALYDRLDDVLSKTASEILKNHPAIKVVHKALDLTDLANVRAMLEHAGDYDVVCNIAGMFDSDGQFMSTATEFERWKRMHDLNTTSLAYANQIAIAHFKAKGKKGAIVNIGSTAGLAPVPFMPIYAAGKSFVIHLSRCLGDLAPQIRVNAVCPGPTKTEGFVATLDIKEGGVGARLRGDTKDGNASLPPSALADGILTAIENEHLFGQTIRVTPGKGMDVYNYRAGKGMPISALTSSSKI